ncbi:efflux RND transporter periplasmic adaptor subunit [Litoribrevibacter albus]|uniref:Resistance-nodulation-cell division multidrug efflux membrane fusion protein MexE n=1 Tax=Litoribrevibacter albus TaxID=1473156 RepID=A0AA37W837_9GAMM|nr:efflux RND transporter periplasmic adaptor subunit [Litoribrevibacter albus]GLQ31106.1 resistance-nodulation-cell division multidrug efflux membrane fusion protein MexE [Litoribrevibacter albus]
MPLQRTLKLFAVITSMAVLSACSQEPAETEGKQTSHQPPAPTVTVAEVLHERLTEWDEFTGRLEAPESVELRPRVSGYIERVAFEEGAIVHAGDPLFYIDSRSFKTEVKRLKAELTDAQSQLKLAELAYNRTKRLTSQNALSKEDYDNRFAELQQARAHVQSVEAALELSELNLSYTRVEAPITGRVSRAEVTKGNYVGAGQTILTTLVSTEKVYAYFDADENTYLKYTRLAKEGSRADDRESHNPVFMALANESDYPHQGHIDFVDNRINPATGTIRGRAVFQNESGLFTPGLFTRLQLIGSASYQGILIDDKAIGTDLNNKFVLVLDQNNTVQYRPVTLGEKVNGLRIISDGLHPGERIVVKGLQRVRPGTPVNPEVAEMASPEQLAQLQRIQAKVDRILIASGLEVPNAETTTLLTAQVPANQINQEAPKQGHL